MTPAALVKRLRKYTKTTSTSLPDADALDLLNIVKDDFSELIAKRDIEGNYFVLPATVDLAANQREYPFPDDMLEHVFSVEAAFTNTLDSLGNLQYILGIKSDFGKFGVSRTEANIRTYFANNYLEFGYEIQRRSVYLLSGAIDSTTLGGATVPAGIRLRYRVYPVDLSALTDNTTDLSVDPTQTTFGMPRAFHELWARKASIDWKAQHPGAVPASQLDGMYAVDLELKLQGVHTDDLSEEIFGSVPGMGGTPDPFGQNHGFNL